MVDEKKKLERIYTINLSAAYDYIRTKRCMRAIKILRSYLARHFKADESNVKLSEALNSYVWRDSMQKPPRRVKVRGVKEGDVVNVYLHNEEEIKKAKEQNKQKKAEKKKSAKSAAKKDEKKEKKPTEKKEKKKQVDEKKK